MLNIPPEVQGWNFCSDDVASSFVRDKRASAWVFPYLKARYDILIYSGDVDAAIPTKGTRQWINALNWGTGSVAPWRSYSLPESIQVAGYIEETAGLTFATIHGAGHMAPKDKRAEAYHLVFNWLFEREI